MSIAHVACDKDVTLHLQRAYIMYIAAKSTTQRRGFP